jgi:hypothetical protein
VGKWYKVTKKIHGRLYDYWQRTERHGKQVKTFNKYIGPAYAQRYRDILAVAGETPGENSTRILRGDVHDSDFVYVKEIDDAVPPPVGFDSDKRWGNSALESYGVNSPAMMEARKHLAKDAPLFTSSEEKEHIARTNALSAKISKTIDALNMGQIIGDEEIATAWRWVERKRAERSEMERELGRRSRSIQEEMDLVKRVRFADPRPPQTPDAPTTSDDRFSPSTLDPAERREDERIRYGNRAARVREQEAAVKAAKRKSRGTGAINPFLGQAINKDKKP